MVKRSLGRMRAERWTSAVVLTLLALAGTARGQTQPPAPWPVLEENTFVRDTLREYYLWYTELPDLDPALYDSPGAYLEAVRFRPLDETFSYITSAAASSSYYSESQFIGIGFSMKQIGDSKLRVLQVFPKSPASEAGLLRGDYLTAIGGHSVEELLHTGGVDAAIGPSEIGVRVEIGWHSPFGEERSAVMTKRPVTIPTVSQRRVVDLDGLPVGYIHFRNFVEPSVPALEAVFADFKARGVTDLILDLRYNGGGLIEVARYLGSLIGGARTNSKVFVELVHNDKNRFRDQTFRFGDEPETLGLPRLVVIATRASASASELVINGLKPFIPVTVVGDRTYGKPVGQYGFEFSDKILFPVAFKNRNAAGVSDYYDGLPADCPASDNLDRPLGDPGESSFAEALYFLAHGRCSAQSESEAAARALQPPAPERELRVSGWRRLVNAW